MSQLKRAFCQGLVISILGLTTGVLFGATVPQAGKAKWDNVKKLNPGQEIKIVMNDAKAYRGRVENVSDEEIKVSLATGNATFARKDILRVSSQTASHRLRNAALGAAIGLAAGVGAAVGARCGADANSGLCFGGTVAFVGGLGAGVGALLPSEGWRDVYRAR